MAPLVVRSRSATPIDDAPAHEYATAQPPWEQRTFARVPYMSPSSLSQTHAERQALPSLWATRERSSNGRPQRQNSFDHGNVAQSCEQSYSRTRTGSSIVRPPLTAGYPTMPSVPYETQIPFPSGPKSAPQLPSFVKALPSPPNSTTPSRSSTKSSDDHPWAQHPSPPPPPYVIAIPGTMSARERTPSCRRPRSSSRERADSIEKCSEKPDQRSFGQRFRLRIKNIFKREPVDETAFIRIGDKHWTDD